MVAPNIQPGFWRCSFQTQMQSLNSSRRDPLRVPQIHEVPDQLWGTKPTADQRHSDVRELINYPNFLPGAQIIMRMSATAEHVLECEIYLLSLPSVS